MVLRWGGFGGGASVGGASVGVGVKAMAWQANRGGAGARIAASEVSVEGGAMVGVER